MWSHRLIGAVLAVALAGAVAPAARADDSGGTPTPSATGGVTYGASVGRGPRPVASLFRLTPSSVRVGATSPRFALRIRQAGVRTVTARVLIRSTAKGAGATVVDLGAIRVGATITHAVPKAITRKAGTYELRVSATDPAGQTLRRTAQAAGRTLLRVTAKPKPKPTPDPSPDPIMKPTPGGTTPSAPATGNFTFPLPHDAASARSTWTLDQGVDIAAPGHTPLYAVGAGTIVGHGISGFGRDAPILHLDSGRYVYYGHAGHGNAVAIGTHVAAGQVISEVGAGIVGISSGPHLEIGFCDANGTPVPGTAKTMLGLLRGSYGS